MSQPALQLQHGGRGPDKASVISAQDVARELGMNSLSSCVRAVLSEQVRQGCAVKGQKVRLSTTQIRSRAGRWKAVLERVHSGCVVIQGKAQYTLRATPDGAELSRLLASSLSCSNQPGAAPVRGADDIASDRRAGAPAWPTSIMTGVQRHASEA